MINLDGQLFLPETTSQTLFPTALTYPGTAFMIFFIASISAGGKTPVEIPWHVESCKTHQFGLGLNSS
jgi:hypothetical protein